MGLKNEAQGSPNYLLPRLGLQSLPPLVSGRQGLRKHYLQDQALDANSVNIQYLDDCSSAACRHNSHGFSSPLLLSHLPSRPYPGRVGCHCWLKCSHKGGRENGHPIFANIQGRLFRCWPAKIKATNINRSSYFLLPRVSKGLSPSSLIASWLLKQMFIARTCLIGFPNLVVYCQKPKSFLIFSIHFPVNVIKSKRFSMMSQNSRKQGKYSSYLL